MEINLMYMVDL